MRTEEKANEIAKKNSHNYGFGLNSDSSIECYQSAMEMAEWQRQQTIDMAVEWLTLNFEEDGKSLRTVYKTKGELLSEFVNDMSR